MSNKNLNEWKEVFSKDLNSENVIPKSAFKPLENVLSRGNLFRYTGDRDSNSEVALLEKEFAQFTGAKYALAVNSCGSAIYLSLLALGVKPDDEVLMSAFTYTAVPSSIINTGAKIVLVECGMDYCIDINDLKNKISTKTKVLVLSHMRGHVCNVDEVIDICKQNNVYVIEDCAHAFGTTFKGKYAGRYGDVGCFSTQSYKILNSGEGGILITDSLEVISKCILYSGSHGDHWKKHFVDDTSYFEKLQEYIPNYSLRMSNIAASLLRSQIPYVNDWIEEYRKKYAILANIISESKSISVPKENKYVYRVSDTIQFNLIDFEIEEIDYFIKLLNMAGINVKYFGSEKNPRYYKSWKYIENVDLIQLPKTDELLETACDIRLPLWLEIEDVEQIGRIINKAVAFIKEK